MYQLSSPAKSKRVEYDEESGPSSPAKKIKQEPCSSSSQHPQGEPDCVEIPRKREETVWIKKPAKIPEDRSVLALNGDRSMDIRKSVNFSTRHCVIRGAYVHFEHYEEEIDPNPFSWESKIKKQFEFDVSAQQWRTIMGLKDKVNAAITRLQDKRDLSVKEKIFAACGGLGVLGVRKYEGNILVKIRNQYVDRKGQLQFSKDRVAITVAQWKLLQQSEDEINRQIAKIEGVHSKVCMLAPFEHAYQLYE